MLAARGAARAASRRLLGSSADAGCKRGGFRPRRIVLVRHGESLGNLDEAVYTTTPDWMIPLTQRGIEEAMAAGRALNKLLAHPDANVFFYHSPYLRARMTLDEMVAQLDPQKVVGVREEPRISEQQFGNLQSVALMQEAKSDRNAFGRFYYRFPDGESALDVYSRVSSFIATVYRDVDSMRSQRVLTEETHIVMVAHGLSARTFIMRWFQLPVADFEKLANQPNGSLLVMERQQNAAGEQWYELSQESWNLLNLHGDIDLNVVRAHGKGFGSRRLVCADAQDIDG
ncbi:hypothetical protein KFE25_005380 [Diacronema lutheri]|uniref:Phosphoglycerate mutase n=1 Tax=Diacronema lutheri TaxID=2081491 RepID=A0A8J5XQ82_DIALT|nr:hypothetical protein KFE25_005380 [Diacronema lutheri]